MRRCMSSCEAKFRLTLTATEYIAIAIAVGAVVTFVATMMLYKDEEADKIDAQG